MKNTALTHIHESLGAKMVPFAGYSMPVQYSGLTLEHLAVREKAGLFDVSHMGEFFVKGPEALDLVQYVISNDPSKLTVGKVQYACLPNEKGGIVDDLLVYKMAADEYMLVVNASNIEKDFAWIQKHNTFDVKLTDRSDEMSLLALQGPLAKDILRKLTDANLDDLPYYSFAIGQVAGVKNVIISNTGYTGAGGFELYFANEDAETIWQSIMDVGAPMGLLAAGLGARDTLRLEKGFCLYGNDINDETSPLEAGLGWITKLSTEFVGAEEIRKKKEAGITKKLVGFEMLDRGIPRQHYAILNSEGQIIGEVTSGTQSPSLGKAIGMGYVEIAYAAPDTEIFIEVRNKQLKAVVVKIPFLK
ncbi:MAG: glycine cleavage system aminomethyltransferase GcvT [Cryomorphaceae bacterium]|nr:glycine cleavage system aminomethyltransferase GcvT [Cryomorphaceae bacterium]